MVDRSLTDADVEAIAERVAEKVAGDRLVSAATLARLIDFDVEWVRAHAVELGAIPVGQGPRPRLRFDPKVAIEAVRNRQVSGGGSRTERLPVVAPRRPRVRRAA